KPLKILEGAKGLDPSTPTLARSCSLPYSIGRHQRRQRPSLSRALAARRVPERDRHGARATAARADGACSFAFARSRTSAFCCLQYLVPCSVSLSLRPTRLRTGL